MQLAAYDIACITQAKDIIDKDCSIHYSIDNIAQKVGLGSTKLKVGFKFKYGMGLYKYLRQQRMQKALIMLKDSDKTIKQIAKATGFKYTTNFITAFKKRFGNSPGKIKRP